MKLEHYLIACSIIAVALLRVHSYFNDRYSGVNYYQQQAQNAIHLAEKRDLEIAKLRFQSHMEKQKIAQYLPELQKKSSYQARNIASVLGNQKINLPQEDLIKKELSLAKKYFTEGNFLSAIDLLESLQKESPNDPRAPEIVYLLMESYHQKNAYKKASKQIDLLLQLYPESHLAGYALIRLGDYYAKEEENKKARQAYDLAIENFSYDQEVLQTARKKRGAL